MKRLFGLSALVLLPAAFAADMKPGLWEYTSKMEMPGAPFAMPPQTAQQCLTQADVDKGKVATDPSGQQQSGCEVKNFKQSGGKVSYDVVCQGSPPTSSHAEFTTTATSMEGTTVTDMGGQKMTVRTTGKRVGDCKGS